MLGTTTIFTKSIEKANEIFNRSENLRDVDANANIYQERDPYLVDLLGEEGYVSFNPFVSKELTIDFRRVLQDELHGKNRAYYRVDHETREDENKARNEYILSD